jgi:hypothetical protein
MYSLFEICTSCFVHRIKSFSIFPSPAGMSLTKLSLGWNDDVIFKLFPPRESLASDIPAGDGNIEKLLYGVQEKNDHCIITVSMFDP